MDSRAAARSVSLDALSGLAPLLRVRPELRYVCRFGDKWTSNHAPVSNCWAPFHIVTEGNCVLHLTATGRSVTLQKGDVAVLPHGSPHVVHSPDTPYDAPGPFGIRHLLMRDIPVQTNTSAPADTEMVCGRLKFDQAGQNLVLSALPDSIVVSAADDRSAPHIQRLISLIKDELETGRPGAAAIASDLASALLVIVVRAFLEEERHHESILSLLGHPKAARAVAAMLEHPGKNWTLDDLARVANTSRSSLVRMFRDTARVSPLAFLTETRLELARRKLQGSGGSLGAIAAEFGYQSESAFSRAFQLHYGIRPGEARGRATA